MLTENIWVVWSKTSYSGDKWRCHRQTTTREDRATQPMDSGWLGFVTKIILQISKEYLDILDISNKKELTYIDNLDNLDLGPPNGGSRQRTL